jgi:hypothetical protein
MRQGVSREEGRKNRIIQGTLEVVNGILRWMLNSNSSEAGGFRLDLLIATKKIDFLSFFNVLHDFMRVSLMGTLPSLAIKVAGA